MRPSHRPSFVILLMAGAAACSRTDTSAAARAGATATTVAAAPAAAAPAAATPDAPLNLCTVMPAADVSRLLQAQIGRAVTVVTPHTGGMCDYKDVDKGVPGVEVLIDFTRHENATDAAQAYQSVHKQSTDMGLTLADVTGVGDEAYGSTDSPESYGIKAQRGRYMGQVNVRARDVSPDALRPAATELAKLTLTRLP